MNRIEIKNKAIILRTKGYSYSYISEKLNISKSTLSDWLAMIKYKPNSYTIKRIGKARIASNLTNSIKKRDSIVKARKEAKQEVGILNKRDIFMLGLGIYIGEGTKTNNIVRIINSDPKIVKFSILWFKNIYDLQISNFAIRIHLYPDNDVVGCIDFWSKNTGIPKSNFYKTYIDQRINKKMSKRGKLPYGTVQLIIKSSEEKKTGVFLARKIKASIDEVLK
jgi:hypothetical protein